MASLCLSSLSGLSRKIASVSAVSVLTLLALLCLPAQPAVAQAPRPAPPRAPGAGQPAYPPAQRPAPEPVYNQIRFEIKTGSDDLRGDSTADAHVYAVNGSKIQDISLKGGNQGSWDNYSTHTVNATLKEFVTATAIGKINITMESHNNWHESDDNWNVQYITVTLLSVGGAQKEIMHFYGDPFHRLSHSDSSFNIPEVPIGPPGTFNTVDFYVKTGSDDLRGNSSVHVLFKSPNGNVLDEGDLHPKDSAHWDSNSENEVQLSLKSPRTPCQLAHTWLTLTSHNNSTETDDNWNVEVINIGVSNNGVEPRALGGGHGDPLQRLTGSLPTLVVEGPDCMANAIPSESATGPLQGFVDLHTHPLSNLGFGGKLIYGGLDIGSLLPADPDCHKYVRAANMQQALGHDGSTHGSFGVGIGIPVAGLPGNVGVSNACGDALREQVIHQTQKSPAADESSDAHGAPDFAEWPVWNDETHQKMWVDWIHRAYLGGLRVMVALAVNNKTLGDMTAGPGDWPTDDKSNADRQIVETKAFVGRHQDFMEVAYSSADLERIVRANKLAVVLGIEVDNLGNLNTVHPLTNNAIAAEINWLYSEGVRYIFPIHLIDNPFGGTALYQDLFNYSNDRESGHWWAPKCQSGVTYNFQSQNSFSAGQAPSGVVAGATVAGAPGALVGGIIGAAASTSDLSSLLFDGGMIAKLHKVFTPPNYPSCLCGPLGKSPCHNTASTSTQPSKVTDPPQWGMVNTLGLLPAGQFAIREMMRHGMLIDIDHMSDLSQSTAFDIANKVPGGYPLNSGHSQERSLNNAANVADTGPKERNMLPKNYANIGILHGMAGLGTAGVDAVGFIEEYSAAMKDMGFLAVGGFGTDTDGLEYGMPPRRATTNLLGLGIAQANTPVSNVSRFYNDGFPESSSGTRRWNYDTDGVAHYGMLYDYLVDMRTIPAQQDPKTKAITSMSGAAVVDSLMRGADYFFQTWKKCEQLKTQVPAN